MIRNYLLLFAILFLIIGGVVFVFMRPVAMKIERSATIHAPVEEVYAKVVDFNEWSKWSPWLVAEPTTPTKVEGDGKSVGSVYSWKGKIIGAGELEHQVITPNQALDMEIRFFDPKSTSKVGFQFEKQVIDSKEVTKVNWYMDSKIPSMLKTLMTTFLSIDYDRGLGMLKTLVEDGEVHSKVEVKGNAERPAMKYMGVEFRCKIEEVGLESSKAYEVLKSKLTAAGIPFPQEFVSVYNEIDYQAREFGAIASCPVDQFPETLPEGLVSGEIPAHNAYQVDHIGSFTHLGNGWFTGQHYLRHKKLKQSKKIKSYEIYPANWEEISVEERTTRIFFPIE